MSNKSAMGRVGIIGAGITGLATAYLLSQRGYTVQLFEQEDAVGGLARSIPFLDTAIERYYHFICRHDDALLKFISEIGLSDQVRWENTAMDYHVAGTLYPFTDPTDLLRFKPLSMIQRLRFGISMLPYQFNLNWQKLDAIPHREWLVRWGGQKAYDIIWKPLMVKKYHHRYGDVPAAWVWGRTRRRSRSRSGFPGKESLGYITGGTQTLVNRLMTEIESRKSSVFTGTRVTRIEKSSTGVIIHAGAETFPVDCVISTVPAPVLAKLSDDFPEEFQARLQGQEYLSVICPIIAVEGKLAQQYWTNIYETEIQYLGVIEYSRLNPDPGFRGHAIAYLPFYVWPDDPMCQRSDDEIMSKALTDLQILFPWFDPETVRLKIVHRDLFSQPMISVGHLKRMFSFETPISGIYMIEPSMIYPEDRGLNNCIRLAGKLTSQYF